MGWIILFLVFVFISIPVLIIQSFVKLYMKKKAERERAEQERVLIGRERKRKEEIRQNELKLENEARKKRQAERKLIEEHKDRLIPQYKKPSPPPDILMGSIIEYVYEDVIVFGTENLESKSHLPEVKIDDSIALMFEDDDIYTTIEILDRYDRPLGYIDTNPEILNRVIDFDNRKCPVLTTVSKVDDKNIYVNITFYELLINKFQKSRTFVFTIKDDDDDIGMYVDPSIGDEVTFEYDFDKDKYAALCSYYEIGYLSDSIEKVIEEDYIALVTKVELDDDLNQNVEVTVYYGEISEPTDISQKRFAYAAVCNYCGVTSPNDNNVLCAGCGAPKQIARI